MQKIPMTVHGAELLREELQRLKTVDRPRVIDAIAEARAHGDLKENAEYHAAREQQGFIEGRIQEIEGKLSNAQIIDVTNIENTGKVIFGTTVTLVHTATDKKVSYKIVGEDEADIEQSKISVTSPIARGMVGKFEGDVIEVRTPEGVTEYEIVEVVHA
jgi:transcription elongation factor GreA